MLGAGAASADGVAGVSELPLSPPVRRLKNELPSGEFIKASSMVVKSPEFKFFPFDSEIFLSRPDSCRELVVT